MTDKKVDKATDEQQSNAVVLPQVNIGRGNSAITNEARFRGDGVVLSSEILTDAGLGEYVKVTVENGENNQPTGKLIIEASDNTDSLALKGAPTAAGGLKLGACSKLVRAWGLKGQSVGRSNMVITQGRVELNLLPFVNV